MNWISETITKFIKLIHQSIGFAVSIFLIAVLLRLLPKRTLDWIKLGDIRDEYMWIIGLVGIISFGFIMTKPIVAFSKWIYHNLIGLICSLIEERRIEKCFVNLSYEELEILDWYRENDLTVCTLDQEQRTVWELEKKRLIFPILTFDGRGSQRRYEINDRLWKHLRRKKIENNGN